MANNRFDLANPLARNLQEQQSKLRAKPYGQGFAGQANVRMSSLNISIIRYYKIIRIAFISRRKKRER
jgi:hypothetical protein